MLRLSSSLDDESLELLEELDELEESLDDPDELDELDELEESSSELSLLELSSLFFSFLIFKGAPFLPERLPDVPGSVFTVTGFFLFRDDRAEERWRRSTSGRGGAPLRRILRSSI